MGKVKTGGTLFTYSIVNILVLCASADLKTSRSLGPDQVELPMAPATQCGGPNAGVLPSGVVRMLEWTILVICRYYLFFNSVP